LSGLAKRAHSWKSTEIADACGVTHRTAMKRLTQRGIVPDDQGRYLPPHMALRAVLDVSAPAASEKDRFDRARADAQEMRNAETRGEFAPATELARIGTEIAAAVRSRFMAIRTVAPAVRATETDGEAAAILEQSAREALEDVARLGSLVVEHRRRKRPGPEDGGSDPDGLFAAAEADDERVG
jgi:hypothetical protein